METSQPTKVNKSQIHPLTRIRRNLAQNVPYNHVASMYRKWEGRKIGRKGTDGERRKGSRSFYCRRKAIRRCRRVRDRVGWNTSLSPTNERFNPTISERVRRFICSSVESKTTHILNSGQELWRIVTNSEIRDSCWCRRRSRRSQRKCKFTSSTTPAHVRGQRGPYNIHIHILKQ